MTDLTADAPLRFKGETKTEKFTIDTTASRTFYKGQPVLIDQNVDATNVVQYVDAVIVVAADVCVGIAAEGKSVVIGDAETTEIEVYVAPTIVGFKSALFANTNLGTVLYKSDSDVLSATSTANAQLGTLFKVEDGYCYVKLTAPQVCAAA